MWVVVAFRSFDSSLASGNHSSLLPASGLLVPRVLVPLMYFILGSCLVAMVDMVCGACLPTMVSRDSSSAIVGCLLLG